MVISLRSSIFIYPRESACIMLHISSVEWEEAISSLLEGTSVPK